MRGVIEDVKDFIKMYKSEILRCCCRLLAIALAVAVAVILIPPETAVIVTDTGHVVEIIKGGVFGSPNYEIIEETKTIVIAEKGEYKSYKYNDWYMFDTIQGKSRWQRWTEK